MKVVEVKELGIAYKRGKVVAVKELSFSVEKGEAFILIGPDGAGKSSTLKAVAGVIDYQRGEVKVFGVNPKREKEFSKVREKLSFMPQGLGQNLYKKLSVEENIELFADIYGVEGKEREERKELLLEITGLKPFKSRQAGKLSGGMMQKLGLCCSLIHKPQLLILDEPTTGVDPVSRREIWRLIYSFMKEGMTVLVATSYLDEAERGSKVALVNEGEALAKGEPEEVSKTRKPVFLVYGEDYLRAYEKLWKVSNTVRLKGKKIRVVAEEEELKEAIRALKVGYKRVEPEIEDFFVEKIGLKRVKLGEAFRPKVKVPEEAVVVKEVVKAFGEFKAVKGVSFTVKRGEIFGLLGPNGAGKTTLIKTIIGLYEPTEGEVVVAGERSRKRIKKLIGYMSQKFSLYTDLTVIENLRLWGAVYGVPRKEVEKLVKESLEVFELREYLKTLVKELPLGIKQRVSLLSALLHRPPILFLDEPTSGVDPKERDVFWQVIRELSNKFGTTVLITTHYLDEAEYCDRLLLMSRGRAVAEGSPDELKEEVKRELGEPFLVYTENPFEDEEKLRKSGFKAVIYGKKVKVFVKSKRKVEEIKKVVKVKKVKEGEITMEDVFVYEVEKDSRNS
ncbi:ATP-binding cassette domain-containing protein [Thermovibrio sp.]